MTEVFLLISSSIDFQEIQQETDPVVRLHCELLDETEMKKDESS